MVRLIGAVQLGLCCKAGLCRCSMLSAHVPITAATGTFSLQQSLPENTIGTLSGPAVEWGGDGEEAEAEAEAKAEALVLGKVN